MAGKFSGRLSGFVGDGSDMFVPSEEQRPRVRVSDLEAISTKKSDRGLKGRRVCYVIYNPSLRA